MLSSEQQVAVVKHSVKTGRGQCGDGAFTVTLFSLITLHRFYIEKITYLKENTTVELFFLNAKSLVFNVSV